MPNSETEIVLDVETALLLPPGAVDYCIHCGRRPGQPEPCEEAADA